MQDQTLINQFEFVLPLCAAERQRTNHFVIRRYAGCAFFLNSFGHIATCAHITDGLKNSEALVANYLNNGKFYFLKDVRWHRRIDFAVARLDLSGNRFLTPFRGTTAIGLDVSAFGFVEAGRKAEDNPVVQTRMLRGYITRLDENPGNSPTGRQICEVSFPSLAGFSGTALTIGPTLVGMLYGNAESQVVVHSFTEIEEGGTKFSEKTTRLVEFGLVHTLDTIYDALQDLGVDNAFQ